MTPPPGLDRLVAELYPSSPDTGVGPQAVAPRRRKKLWELEDKLHCPVIGSCVPLPELRRIARRHRFESDFGDEFALHVEAVQRSMARSDVALTLQRYLERQYALAIRQFDAARSDEEVRALWQARLAAGDVAGALWATCTHRAASDETRHIAYADVHMLSHQVGAGQAADTRRLAQLERESAQLRTALDQERRERVIAETVFRERIRQLEADVAQQQRELAALPRLRTQLAAFESGAEVVELGRRLHSLELANQQMGAEVRRSSELEAALKSLRQQADALLQERNALAEERDALERLLLPAEPDAAPCADACQGCELDTRDGRCVLCVGGRTALVAQYRALAQRLGVKLLHHDGGQEEALSRLPELIRSADAVICPTDCVSHAAYYQLKRHCKASGKPCLLFRGAGVSSFAVALTRLSAGAVPIGAPHASAAD